jgi:transposase
VVNDATRLLDLDGLAVVRIERQVDASRWVHLVTDEEAARAYPGCGVA